MSPAPKLWTPESFERARSACGWLAAGFTIFTILFGFVFVLGSSFGVPPLVIIWPLLASVCCLAGVVKLKNLFAEAAGERKPVMERIEPAERISPRTEAAFSAVRIEEPKSEMARTRPVVRKKPAGPSIDWEQWIGKRLLQIVGVLIVLVGMVVLIKQAFENQWIDELGRLLIAAVMALALLICGDVFRKKYATWSQTFTGGGLTLLYFVVWAAHVYYAPVLLTKYGLAIGPTMAFSLYIAITAIGAGLTLRYNAQPVAWFTLLGGYLTPMLIDTPAPNAMGLSIYLFILGMGLLGISWKTSWRPLEVASFLLTQLYLFGVIYPSAGISNAQQALIAIAFFILFSALPLLRQFKKALPSKNEDIVGIIVQCLAVYLPVREALGSTDYATMATSLGLAAVLLLFGAMALRLRSNDNLLVNSYLSGTFLLIALALYAQLHWEWVAIAWAPYSVALLLIALKLKRTGVWHCASLVLAGALGVLFFRMPVFTYTPEMLWQPFTSTWAIQSYVIFASILGWIYLLRQVPAEFVKPAERPRFNTAFHGILALLLLMIVTFEATKLQWIPTLTLSYAYVALAALGIILFSVTGIRVWFVLAFLLHILLLFFMFATGNGSTLAFDNGVLSPPLLHAWLPISLAAGAMACAMILINRKRMSPEQNRNVEPLLFAVLIAQVWMHGTVELNHATAYYHWSYLTSERILSAWWTIVAFVVIRFLKAPRWQLAGVLLLAIPEWKDLSRILDHHVTFIDIAAWTIIPALLAFYGSRMKNMTLLKGGVVLLAATIAADIFAGINIFGYGAASAGLLHSIWWAITSLCVLIGGFTFNEGMLRRTGMIMFIVTAAKLLLLDFSTLETPVRIAASVATGLLMIFGSYLYQRFGHSSNSRS